MSGKARLVWPAILPALFLFICVAFAGLLSATRPAAASAETDCFNFVQGNIPWNYTGTSSWNPTNVKNLCKGTSKAAEPGRCFDRVMSGGINWGGGTQWQWQNALKLCKGTNNANNTVACFQSQITGGETWQTAIAACATAAALPPPPAPTNTAETACFNFVQGNIPWNYAGASTWNPTNVKNLCKGTTKSAEPGRCFDRVMSGGINWGGGTNWQWQNALNLCKGTNNANNTVACFQSQITGGETWQTAIAACKS